MIDVLVCQDLDDRDVRLLLLTDALQERMGSVSYKDLSRVMGISTKTIQRRFKNLYDLGILSAERVGSKGWRYDIALLHHETGPSTLQNPQIVYEAPREESVPRHPDVPSLMPVWGHPDVHIGKPVTGHQGVRTSPITDLNNYRKETNYSSYSSYPERALAKPMKITGPEGTLADVLRSSQERSTVEKEKRLRKVRKKFEEDPSSSNRSQTPQSLRHMEFEEKSDSEYNASDMQLVYRQEWKKAGLKGLPLRWTLADLGKIKDLMNDQSAETVSQYIRYVFENWSSILQRFSVTGYPTVSTIYGFRRTWLPECLNGPQGAGKKRAAEFNAAEADKIPSGSWGF